MCVYVVIVVYIKVCTVQLDRTNVLINTSCTHVINVYEGQWQCKGTIITTNSIVYVHQKRDVDLSFFTTACMTCPLMIVSITQPT